VSPDQATSTTTRFLYQPHDWQTVCGVFALPQRGQVLRAGASSFQLPARRLRVFDFDFFFFGTATWVLRTRVRPDAVVHPRAGTHYR